MSAQAGIKPAYSAARIAARVASLGRAISRDYAGRTLDVVILLENAFLFGADLVRRIDCPLICHFVRPRIRDFEQGGRARREIFFSRPPSLRGRNVLIVDGVLHSGVTHDFLVKRLQEDRPRSLRLAVLLDYPAARKVDIQPDYFGFAGASNYLVGYGLSGPRGLHRSLPYLGVPSGSRASRRAALRAPRARKGSGK